MFVFVYIYLSCAGLGTDTEKVSWYEERADRVPVQGRWVFACPVKMDFIFLYICWSE